MDSNSIHLMLGHIGNRAGVTKVYPNRFRHTFAIQYVRYGGDVFSFQRKLGHYTLEIVRRYIALADTDSAEAHRKASPADRWHL
jgi:site-specific recombinase XerD